MATQACPKCQHQNPIDAVFCLNCGTQLSRACSNCGQPAAVSTPIDETRLNQLAATTPVPLAKKMHAAEPDHERKIVTVPFADVMACPVEGAGFFTQRLFVKEVIKRIHD